MARPIQPINGLAQGHTMPLPPRPAGTARNLPQRPGESRKVSKWWVIGSLAGLFVLLVSTCAALTLGIGMIYAGGILPKVSAAGIDLGGMSETQAANALSRWNNILLTDGERAWSYNAADLGITIDANATAQAAYEQGRSTGSAVQAIVGKVEVDPVLNVDKVAAATTFDELASEFEIPAVNAGVQLVNGAVEATPPKDGRRLDVAALMGILQNRAGEALADGRLELPMTQVLPSVTDSTPMIAQATQLLANPLMIEAYDPIKNTSDYWQVMPQEWSRWLTATADANSAFGLALTLDTAPLRDYLTAQVNSLGAERYLNVDEAVSDLQKAVTQGRTDAITRVYHRDTQHTVASGETLMGIAWDYGVPYPWIQKSNPSMGEYVTPGQTITIPSADNFLEFPVVFNKRIIVSISQQRTRVYENGQLKWDWATSTGINDSPTWPGIYQVLLHDPNAYAANWNLYMPWFLGVYRPIPDTAFTNGFHGFPTRGGSQLLWTNSLGTRVTYGCILVSSENAKLLYDWAQEGVVVEIQA
jgi:lipoprotein-anchoring transpeptidase ErfK/SrfK